MELEPLHLLLLIGVGLIAGIINTIAGGGSLLTLPALIFLGLPAPIANGTNRIGILMQSLVGTWSMYRKVGFPVRLVVSLAIPTTLGAIAGAWVAAQMSADGLEVAIAVALIAGAVLILARPKRFLRQQEDVGAADEPAAHRPVLTGLVLVAVGFYGGFLQAGVGALFLIALVAVGRFDLLRATGAKNLLIAIYTVPALLVFVLHDEVSLVPGLALAVGAMGGAEVGARLAVRGGEKLILGAVVLAVLLAATRLLGLL